MSLTGYITSLDWIPDEDIVNAAFDPEYLGWQLGVNRKDNSALWVLAPLVDDPTPIGSVIPEDSKEITINDDIVKYGYVRTVMPASSISDVETQFNLQAATISGEVIDGFRSS